MAGVTNPWGFDVNYHRDHTGLVRHVGGASYHGVTTYATNIEYRASGAVKAMTYGNNRQLRMQYDTRLRLTGWEVAGVNSYQYHYRYDGYPVYENTGRVVFADNLYDSTLDRSYEYDHLGRLHYAYTGAEAGAHWTGGPWPERDGPYSNHFHYDVWGNLRQRAGWVEGGVGNESYTYDYAGNRVTWMQYDASGNVTYEGGRFAYDATGQQTWAGDYPPEWGGYTLAQMYDGDRLRAKKVERGVATYYVRSSVLGGQVVAELNGAGQWWRGFVYDSGAQLLAIQQAGVRWVHQDPVTKSQRLTDGAGAAVAGIELDPWGGRTGERWNWGGEWQPRKYTSYDRDDNGRDQAMQRSYHSWFSRFDQPDPSDGSYDLSDPQSFNRYAYVQNDPVNFVDPTGLDDWPFGLGPPPPLPGIIRDSVTVVADAGWSWGWGFGGGISRGIDPLMLIPLDPIGGGGGDPAPEPPQNPLIPNTRPIGPCVGHNGQDLKYDELRKKPDDDGAKTAREHITNRHINQLPKHKGKKSVYVLSGGGNWSPSSTELKQAMVGSLNAITFNAGIGTPAGTDRYMFVFDFNMLSPTMPPPYTGGQSVVGRVYTNTIKGKITSRNLLIVEKDCQTVVTAYPF